MTKSERDERFADYSRRSPRELADLLVQADEHDEKQNKRIRNLIRELSDARNVDHAPGAELLQAARAYCADTASTQKRMDLLAAYRKEQGK